MACNALNIILLYKSFLSLINGYNIVLSKIALYMKSRSAKTYCSCISNGF